DEIELPLPSERNIEHAEIEPEVWPTPAGNTLFVQADKLKEPAGLSLTDLYGREVFKQRSWDGGQLAIPVDQLISGVYQLNIKSGQHIVRQRIVISH
ncbi:MAG: T9SS type A sorting domain-containing protein, partial [Bacteroidota bacterium]